MSLSALMEGERKLLGVLGVNVGLGGIKTVAQIKQVWIDVMPTLPSILTAVQILVALATLVYMLLKIRKVFRSKGDTE